MRTPSSQPGRHEDVDAGFAAGSGRVAFQQPRLDHQLDLLNGALRGDAHRPPVLGATPELPAAAR
jgi:hypothetical protein